MVSRRKLRLETDSSAPTWAMALVALMLVWVALSRSGLLASVTPPTPVPANQPTPVLSQPTPVGLERVQVLSVIDGDTVRVRTRGEVGLVRLIGIDAPEVGPYTQAEPFGAEATAHLKQLLSGGEAYMERDVSDLDRYGRWLRYLWADGQLLNERMVRQGLAKARPYAPDTARQAELDRAETAARLERRGIWSQ